MGCDDVERLAADLAFGLASGDERADALAHIETCRACRALVAELTGAADALVVLARPVEPPAGFEERVMARIAAGAPLRANGRRLRLAVAVAAIVLVCVLAGAAIARRATSNASRNDVARATMRTQDAVAVGDVYVVRGDLRLVFVDVPRWKQGQGDYYVRVELEDGTTTQLAATTVEGAEGSYAAALSAGASPVANVALVDAAGDVLCSAAIPA